MEIWGICNKDESRQSVSRMLEWASFARPLSHFKRYKRQLKLEESRIITKKVREVLRVMGILLWCGTLRTKLK